MEDTEWSGYPKRFKEEQRFPLMDLSNVPYDVLVHILSYVDHKTQVFSCRFVNSQWQQAVESESLRKYALHKIPKPSRILPWYCYYHVANGLFYRNLMKNPCGHDKLRGWSALKANVPEEDNDYYFNPENNQFDEHMEWQIERPPINCSELPEEVLLEMKKFHRSHICCFVSSYYWCGSAQLVELRASPKFMNEIKPIITASVWYAPRRDCGSEYIFYVELLDSRWETLLRSNKFTCKAEQWSPATWKKATIEIDQYVDGVHYVNFVHKGKDTQYWDGNYGMKATLAKVTLSLPK